MTSKKFEKAFLDSDFEFRNICAKKAVEDIKKENVFLTMIFFIRRFFK